MTTTTEASAEATTPTLTDFYLTFGVQYRHEPHPYWPGAHPDGWVQIHTKDESTARRLAVRHFGIRWSMLYDELSFNPDPAKRTFYPLGCIALITDDGATSTITGVEPPTPHITESDPEYHGVNPAAVVAVRVEGHLKEGASDFYDAELFHRDCAGEGRDRFKEITEEDDQVRAFELDWASPALCGVCDRSLT